MLRLVLPNEKINSTIILILGSRFTLFRFLLLLEESYNRSVVFNTSFLNRRILKLHEICSAKSENSTPKAVMLFSDLALFAPLSPFQGGYTVKRLCE